MMTLAEKYERHKVGLKSALKVIEEFPKDEAIKHIKDLIAQYDRDIKDIKENENAGN